MSGQTERIKPGYKLVLTGPGTALLDQEPLDHIERPWPWLSQYEFNDASLSEYATIHNLLKDVVSAEKLVVLKDLTTLANLQRVSWKNLGTVDIPSIQYPQELAWPRDVLTLAGDEVLIRYKFWRGCNGWKLGEGGAVLSRNRTLLVAESLFNESLDEISDLSQRGVQIRRLPHVRAFAKTSHYKHHIDGHASLIEGQDHNLVLFVARSYFLQNRGRDRSQIEMATKNLGIGLEVVNDKNLPPLAFNLIQLDDGAVVMTGGADELESAISQVLGREKVFATYRPIELIPTYGGGGIRCMTNIFPRYLIG